MTMSLHSASPCDRQRKLKGPSKALGDGRDQPGMPLNSTAPGHDEGSVIPSYKFYL